MKDERARVCGVRNVRKTGNVGFTLFCEMLAMCGRRVRNYASAHAAVRNADVLAAPRWGPPRASHPMDVVRGLAKCQPSKGRRAGACQVPDIQEATGEGHPVSASREGRIFLTTCIRAGLGAIPSGNQETARECAQVLPAKGYERVALHPAAG